MNPHALYLVAAQLDAVDAHAALTSAAHSGAYGNNDQAEPTQAQAVAGNYKLGRASVQGLRIAIEQPQGSIRRGVGPDGKEWASRMAAHYGYFEGTKGADGDGIDCFIGPFPESQEAFVINQNSKGGGFDEHKVMVGFMDEQHARAAYLNSYERGWGGLKSIVPLSISQLRWWLKHGKTRVALTSDQLPEDGNQTMNKVEWNRESPKGMTIDKVLYEARRLDGADGLLLDSVTMAEIMDDTEGVISLDALVVEYAQMSRTAERLRVIMDRTGGEVKAPAVQVSEPFKARGVTNIAAVYELSDGQTVSIFFHNPDTTPNKLTTGDELISWKWLLNKKDITIVVAPEKGQDLNPRIVAQRIMKLAEKNSAAFQKANAKRAERLGAIQEARERIASKEAILSEKLAQLEAAKLLQTQKVGDQDAANAATREKVKQWLVSAGYAVKDSVMGQFTKTIGERMLFVTAAKSQLTALLIDTTKLGNAALNPSASDFHDALIPTSDGKLQPATGYVVGFEAVKDFVDGRERDGVTVMVAAEPAAVELTGNELGQFPDTPDGKKQLRAAVKGHLQSLRGSWILCESIGKEIEIRKRGIKETLAFSGDTRKLKILAAIEELIRVAKPVNPDNFREGNNKPESKDALGYYRMQASPVLEGESITVEIIVEEDVNGLLHYDLLVPKTKTALDSAEVVALISQNNYSWIGVDDSVADDESESQVALDAVVGDMVLNLFIEVQDSNGNWVPAPDDEEIDNDSVAKVDAAYQFANATDAFKERVAESIDKTDYSEFASAKAMDLKAKELGAEIHWGLGATLDGVEDEDDFDAQAEFDACPVVDTDEDATLDGDFKGHPFRGNQYKKASAHSHAAVKASISAKHAEKDGDAKGAKTAHKSAHYSHMAAAESTTGKARRYHRKMAKFHGGKSGMALDGVEGWDDIEGSGYALDDAGDFTDSIVGKIMQGGELKGRAVIGGDGKAMVFVGESNDKRVQYWSKYSNSMENVMWTEDDGAHMVELLLVPEKPPIAEDKNARSGTAEEQAKANAAMDMAVAVAVDELGGTFSADGHSGEGTLGAWTYGMALVNGVEIRLAASGGGVVQINGKPHDPSGEVITTPEQVKAAILAVAPVLVPDQGQHEADLLQSAVQAVADHTMARLVTNKYFTFPHEGDEVIVSDEVRAQVEAAIGEPLVEAVLEGLEGQVTLVPASKKPNDSAPSPEPAAEVDNDVTRLNAALNAAPKDRETVSSDDPQAIEKLEKKLAALQMRQEFMKKVNRLIKKGDDSGLLAMGLTQASIDALKKPDFAGRVGYADYELTNNNGVISNTRKRLEDLQLRKAIEATPQPEVPTVTPDPVSHANNAQDREFLMSVIDGTNPEMLEPELATKIEAAYQRNSADAEMVSLFNQAVNSYTQAMMAATVGV